MIAELMVESQGLSIIHSSFTEFAGISTFHYKAILSKVRYRGILT